MISEKENSEFKQAIDLEREGHRQVVPAQDRLHEWCSHKQSRLQDQW